MRGSQIINSSLALSLVNSALVDDAKVLLGTGADAELYFDGTNTVLDPGGELYVGAAAAGAVRATTIRTVDAEVVLTGNQGTIPILITSNLLNPSLQIMLAWNAGASAIDAYFTLNCQADIDLNGNDLNDVATIDGGGDAIEFDDPIQHNAGIFAAYTTTAQTCTASFSDIEWEAQRRADADFTHSTTTNADEITINVAGEYRLTVDIATENTGGADRSESYAFVQQDDGGGYAVVPASETWFYNRDSTHGTTAGSITLVITAVAGTKIKVRCLRNSDNSTNTIQLVANACRIYLERI